MSSPDNWVGALEPRRLLSAGDLDLAFGAGGSVSTRLGGDLIYSHLARQSDGKLLVAATIESASSDSYQLVLARYSSKGKLDASFGASGKVAVPIPAPPPNRYPVFSSPLIDGGGRILVFADGNLMRFTPAGKLDDHFGTHGVRKGIGSYAMAFSTGGKLLVALDNTVSRYFSDGTLDKSFGNKGTATFPLNGDFENDPAFANDLDVQPDGKILLSLQIGSGDTTGSIDERMVRFTAGGKLDRSFGGDGAVNNQPVTSNIFPIDTVVAPDGGIVTLMSHEDGGSWIVKLTRNGRFDRAFANRGVLDINDFSDDTYNSTIGESLLVQPDGKLIAIFKVYSDDGTGIVQTLSDGAFDPGFSNDGKALIPGSAQADDAARGRDNDVVFVSPKIDYSPTDELRLTAVQTQPPTPAVRLGTLSSAGIFTVNGTDGNDGIHFQQAGSTTLGVFVNGAYQALPVSKINGIVVNAGAGNDGIIGDSSVQIPMTLRGDAGDDYIVGGNRGDHLLGKAGNDHLEGIGGNDHLYGGDGDDELLSSDGHDTLHGGNGNDLLDNFNYASDDIFGDEGTDTIQYFDPRNIRVLLDDQPNDGTTHENDNVHSDIENVITGGGDDLIVGSAANNQLEGGAGNDTIWGGPGADTLLGGPGNDEFHARDGQRDTLDGSDQTDKASRDESESVTDEVLNIETFV